MNSVRPTGPSSDVSEGTLADSAAPLKPAARRWWPWPVSLVALAAPVLLATCGGAGKPANPRGDRSSGARAIPVVALPARSGDLGVYQTGLGTVTPIWTVTVRSRVDGQLLSVAFREGQHVRAGDLLAQIDPRPFEVQLHQAEGQLAKDQAALKNAKLDLERYKVLIDQDSISRQQYDAQTATVDQSEAAIRSDQAQVESAKLNLTYSRITAPSAGVVGLRLVDPGNIVHANDPNGLVVITELQPITVLFTIPADRLPPVLQQIKAGRRLAVEAWDRALKTKLASGSVLAIDNQIDQTTGTVRIKALFPNEDAALYPNQFVNARLLVETLHDAVLIPTAALERSAQSTYVYVVKADSTVATRKVDLRYTEGDDTALTHGVAVGEMVVVDGLDKLQEGSHVTLAQEGVERKPRR
jgi:multidrug efflux system membrane fusion protein